MLTVTAAAPGYSAVLLTLLAGWDASPRDISAAMAWGVMSAAKYTHLQAGTLTLVQCLGWQAAGESGMLEDAACSTASATGLIINKHLNIQHAVAPCSACLQSCLLPWLSSGAVASLHLVCAPAHKPIM